MRKFSPKRLDNLITISFKVIFLIGFAIFVFTLAIVLSGRTYEKALFDCNNLKETSTGRWIRNANCESVASNDVAETIGSSVVILFLASSPIVLLTLSKWGYKYLYPVQAKD